MPMIGEWCEIHHGLNRQCQRQRQQQRQHHGDSNCHVRTSIVNQSHQKEGE